ncbi:DUF1330 domain-containing protein [Yersinia aleksiciae]|uniref:DUF1330 domain-containing protein n=1 Tax=Yersinia aleksiciae TaxID=263819 RepID=UPI0011A03E6C|nr:DUF1330 domain-containing protein [Yersinia aleksiciae]
MKKILIRTITALGLLFSSIGYAQDTQPRGYMIANYDIKDQVGFQKYMDAAGTLAPKYHGTVTVFNLNATAVEGNPRSVIAIAEFPSLADAQRFYNSPEYTAAKKFRIASTEGSVILTEGFVPQKP